MPEEFCGIELQKVIDILHDLSKEFSFSTTQEHLYKLLISSCPITTIGGNPYVEKSSIKNWIQNFKHALKTGDSSSLRMERGLRVSKMVDVIEFSESNEYMAQAGAIRPVVKYELNRLFHSGNYYLEVVLAGGTSAGKNYTADLGMAYLLYQLSCYKSPQIEFGLAPGSPIFFIIQSLSMTANKRVAFGQFASKIKLSPYFQKYFRFDPSLKTELHFPHNISVVPISGTDVAALGMNVWSFLGDEMAFRQRIKKSVHTQFTGETEYDQAQRSYNVIVKRIKGRFMQLGKVPGKLFLVSSANYEGDFIDRKLKEARTDPTIFVMFYSQWDAIRDEQGNLPSDKYSGEMFLVEKGNDVKTPRIIESREDAVDSDDVVEVPIEYKPDFEKDIIQSLKDYAGVGSGVSHPFIMQRELIKHAADGHILLNEGRQLFTSDTLCLNTLIDPEDENPDWELVINHEYLENLMSPSVVFATHIDLAKNQDACGISIGHIIEYAHRAKITVYDKSINNFRDIEDVMVPVYMIDGALQIVPPPADEISYELIKRLVLYLQGKLYLKWASMDVYNSVMMIQAFRKYNIRCGQMSVDVDTAPYQEVKAAIKDERIYYPNSAVLLKELRELEIDNKKNKVDHPSNGSKDVSDSVAGVVHLLFTKEAIHMLKPSSHRRSSSGEGRVRRVRLEHKRSVIRSRQ